MDFEGSVATVTGAASGIGRASAIGYAQAGADVVVSDIDEAGAKATVDAITELGRKATFVACDVSVRQQVESLVAASIDWQGHCDLFMSNAGIGVGGAPHMIPQQEWDRILAINLHSHVWAIRTVIPHMLERGSGHLVHVASSAGTIGFAQLIPYCMTKFGVVGLAESLAVWLRPRGVGVSVVCPLLVNTNIFEASTSFAEDPRTPDEEDRLMGMMRQVIKDTGMPPEQVASDIVDAVKANRFYVFPHPELKDMIDNKWADTDAFIEASAQAFTLQEQMASQMAEG